MPIFIIIEHFRTSAFCLLCHPTETSDFYPTTSLYKSNLIFYGFLYEELIFSMVAIPVYVRHTIHMKAGSGGRIELTVGPKQNMGKVVGLNVS